MGVVWHDDDDNNNKMFYTDILSYNKIVTQNMWWRRQVQKIIINEARKDFKVPESVYMCYLYMHN